MNHWAKYFIAAVVFGLLVWGALFYGVGNYYLADRVVTINGIELRYWVTNYDKTGAVSIFAGLICAALWNVKGANYDFSGGISAWYNIFWALSLVFGVVNWVMSAHVMKSIALLEGGLWPGVFVILAPAIIYWLVTLVASPEKVKNVPFGR